MKKRNIIVLILLLCLVVITLVIVLKTNISKHNKVDYAKLNYFTDITWVRETEYDTETIYFNSDGIYGYSCSCGNPVNDSDLCDRYIYDENTKTITLQCDEKTSDMITTIKIISCSKADIELDFDGEIRKFHKEI